MGTGPIQLIYGSPSQLTVELIIDKIQFLPLFSVFSHAGLFFRRVLRKRRLFAFRSRGGQRKGLSEYELQEKCASDTTPHQPLATSVSTVKAAEGNKPTCKNLNKVAVLGWGGG